MPPPPIKRQLTRDDYHIAWLCALPDVELPAARCMLDDEHEPPPNPPSDINEYVYGSINSHNIVIASMPPRKIGPVSAADLVGPLKFSFPYLKIHLFVGIGGGIPRSPTPPAAEKDVYLGDVVVGWPKTEDDPAVVNWDFGAVEQHGPNVTNLRQVGQMKEPDAPILAALGRLLGNHREKSTRFDEHLRRLDRIAQFGHPGRSSDRLFQPDCACQTPNATILCSCDQTKLVKRKRRPERGMSFIFHQGTILSGNSFMMNAAVRDELRARYPNALCLEMEAAGALPQSRALVVRGICDYADSHVNRKWQNYAAGTAAAFVRERLFTKAPQALHDRPNTPQMSSTAQEMVRCFAFNSISLNRGNKYLNYRRDV